jgi:acyl-coenzyme A thioesterase PaaI-like protein
MDKLKSLTEKAKQSKFGMWMLNFVLGKFIPFNKPHGFKIYEIGNLEAKVIIPYKKVNFNHIKGTHACAMATAAEFCTGFTLLNALNPKEYRLILKSLNMEYHFQGKKDVFAHYKTDQNFLNEKVITPLQNSDKILVTCVSELHDKDGNHIATGNTTWQIKKWSSVKTKA